VLGQGQGTAVCSSARDLLVARDRSTRLRAVCLVYPLSFLRLSLAFLEKLFPIPGPLAQLVELRTFNP
jgi:hypothetical protein